MMSKRSHEPCVEGGVSHGASTKGNKKDVRIFFGAYVFSRRKAPRYVVVHGRTETKQSTLMSDNTAAEAVVSTKFRLQHHVDEKKRGWPHPSRDKNLG